MKLMRKSMPAVVFLLSGAMTLGAVWTTKRLTDNTGMSYMPSIAASGSNVYVVWYDTTPGNQEIYFKKSTDKGATWQTAKRLTNNEGASFNPRIAVSGANVYVVWHDATPGNYEIYFRKSTDYGATWQTAKRLTNTASGYSRFPSLAVDTSIVYVVYESSSPGNPEVYFKKSIDGGATWQTTKRLTNNTGNSFSPTIAVNTSNVSVVWEDFTPGNNEIYFRKSTDSGATWQTAKRLTNNTGNSWDPKIAVRSSNVYVVWHDDTPGNSEVYFRKSADSGATWQTARKLTNTASAYYSSYPSLAAYTANVYVVYENNAPGNPEVYFKKSGDGGATWPTTQRLTNNAGSSHYPDIALGGGNIFVVWYDNTPGNLEIYLKYSPL